MGQLEVSKAEHYDINAQTRQLGDNWVAMSNALTRAGHGLTLGEKRLVFCAISKIDSKRMLRPGEAPTSRVTVADYVDVAKCEPSAAYEALQTAAKNLYNRTISFYVQAKNRKGRTADESITHMRWVGRATYKKTEGWVELAWWHEVLPHLIGLQKGFTQYQLRQTHALRSVYSWKLLELLIKFESTGWAQYTIDDFSTAMEATPKQRENFANIRRKIIEPAIKELTEKNGWNIQFRQIKAGRKVQALRFDFVLPADFVPAGAPEPSDKVDQGGIPEPSPSPSSSPYEDRSNTCPACGIGQRLEGFSVCKTCAEELSD